MIITVFEIFVTGVPEESTTVRTLGDLVWYLFYLRKQVSLTTQTQCADF